MASAHQAILAPHAGMIRSAMCEPAAALPGEIVVVRAEVYTATEPPPIIAMRVRSAEREVVAEASLTPETTQASGTHPVQYAYSWLVPAGIAPGAYDVLLRLPGAERSSRVALTVLPFSIGANLESLRQALELRMKSRLASESGNLTEAAALMEAVIDAYQRASQPNAAAEAMLDAANLYILLSQRPRAAALYRMALNIREAAGEIESAAYCRRQLASLSTPGAGTV